MIKHIFQDIKWFCQRGKRGWADCDVWDFNDYLAGIIIAGLERLKKEHHGCSSEFWDEKVENDECHKWSETLEIMIQGFKAYKDSYDEPKWIKGKFKQEIDSKKIDLLEKKFQHGIKLFAKYFAHLWD